MSDSVSGSTGFYDIYTGGIFDMWNSLDKETRELSALAVSAYGHNDNIEENAIEFPNGKRAERLGEGERLRIDISSADNAHYIRSVNKKGLFCSQTTCRIAHNTVYPGESYIQILTIPFP